MKYTWYALVFMVSWNLAIISLQSDALGISPTPLTGLNTTDVEEDLNTTKLVDSWDWADREFYDIGAAVGMFWNLLQNIIVGAPNMLDNMGAPSIIVRPLSILWKLIWVGWFFSLISGRDFMP